MLDDESEQSRNLLLQVHGCLDYANVLVAVLRARGIPAKFARIHAHSVAVVRLGNRWYEAGLNARTNKPEMNIIDWKLAIRRRKQALEGAYKTGLDSHDIGILSWRDFHKYTKRRRIFMFGKGK